MALRFSVSISITRHPELYILILEVLMRSPFSSKLLTFLVASLFACVALPGFASAGICDKIDYTFASKIMDQVRLYAGNSAVTASDAGCVLRNISFASTQEEVGIYLSSRLVDPHNIDVMLEAVTFPSTRESITKAVLMNRESQHLSHSNYRPQPRPSHQGNAHGHHQPTRPSGHHPNIRPSIAPPTAPSHHPSARPSVAPPTAPSHRPVFRPQPVHHNSRIKIVENVNTKIDYTFSSKVMDQVRLYVGDAYLYASDAAEILKKSTFTSVQQEIGTYLCPRIADRENLNVFINAPTFSSVRESLVQACMN